MHILQATDPETTERIINGARDLYPDARLIVRRGRVFAVEPDEPDVTRVVIFAVEEKPSQVI